MTLFTTPDGTRYHEARIMANDESVAQNFTRQLRKLSENVSPQDMEGYIVLVATPNDIAMLATGETHVLRRLLDSAEAPVAGFEAQQAAAKELKRQDDEAWLKALDEVPTARLEAALARRQAVAEPIDDLIARFGLKVTNMPLGNGAVVDCNDPLCPVHGVGGAGA